MSVLRFIFYSPLLFLLLTQALLISFGSASNFVRTSNFSIQEATIEDIRLAFKEKRLTSKQLVKFYLKAISKLNPTLHAVIETNPDALIQAEIADRERKLKGATKLPILHGVPVLLKDSISTKDKLNTTAVIIRGREWNEPKKTCNGQMQPLIGSTYPGGSLPAANIVSRVLSSMRTPVYLLDITTLSQLRKDAHPSTYGDGGGTDCSHWCLPGLPDTWNQLLYAALSM